MNRIICESDLCIDDSANRICDATDWDKDYAAESAGINLFPALATVTCVRV